jgi:uncharacterized protein
MNKSLYISPTVTFVDDIDSAYNWLNGEYVSLDDKRHPFYKILKNSIYSFSYDFFDSYEDDLEWLIENHFIIDSYKQIETKYKENIAKLYSDTSLHLVLLPAGTKCNFRCLYCYQDHNSDSMNTIEQNEILAFIKNNKNLKSLQIDFFGGEPLLNYKWIYNFSQEIVSYTSQNSILYKASITTNGYLLTKDIFTNLVQKCHIKTYQVTLDGLEDTHDKLRPLTNNKPTYKQIFQNINDIAQSDLDYSIIFRVNFNEQFDIDSFINRLKQTNIYNNKHFFFIFRPISSGWNCTQNDVYCKDNQDVLKKEFYAKMIKENFKSAEYILYSNFGNFSCPTGRPNYLIILPNMTIRKCTVALDDEINDVGTIQNGILQTNKNYEKWINKNIYNKPECQSCNIYSLCLSSSCPLYTIKNNETKCIEEKHQTKTIAKQIINFINNHK